MNYTVNLISQKKYLTLGLSVLFIGLTAILVVPIYFELHIKSSIWVAIGFIIIFPVSIISGFRFSRRKIDIILDEHLLKTETDELILSDISGYYINTDGTAMNELNIKYRDHNISISAQTTGETGKEFKKFLSDFKVMAAQANPDLQELGYYDFHKTFLKFQKGFIPVFGIIVIALNLFYFYWIFAQHKSFNSKIFIVDISYISLYFFHKRNISKLKKD